MVFFLSVRESTTHPGTIEPDISMPSAPTVKAGLKEYLTTWDRSDSAAFARRIAVFVAFGLHVPMNVISLLSRSGLSFILGELFSVLNLVCVGLALWKIDLMRGSRLFYNRLYTRLHFDYAILGLLLSYALLFAMLLWGKMVNKSCEFYACPFRSLAAMAFL
ncbi:hypothetical protein HYALB_00005663 [Hymenoscyphus albidus]|uniref:Uncharacterized protein n=1 Tax=Hymenoscyphus albidus TaxID=595503 RepID=A0A9N9LKD1_9HELO|nr:hypothetical protein HYALB_00005663 [Hymenoscyphus albidus]